MNDTLYNTLADVRMFIASYPRTLLLSGVLLLAIGWYLGTHTNTMRTHATPELYVSESIIEGGLELSAIVPSTQVADAEPLMVTWRYGANKETPMQHKDQHDGFSVYHSFVPLDLNDLNADLFVTYTLRDSAGAILKERVSPVALVFYTERIVVEDTVLPTETQTASVESVIVTTPSVKVVPPTPPTPHTPTPSRPNALANMHLYTATDSRVAKDAAEAANQGLSEAALLQKIAEVPAGVWLTSDRLTTPAFLRTHLDAAQGTDTVPVFVVYTHTSIGCWDYAEKQEVYQREYLQRITLLADTIGSSKAVIIMEPDALALKPCFYAAGKEVNLLRKAVATITTTAPNAVVYLDAGHAAWIGVAEMADRLNRSGIELAQGFSLNTSNYIGTPRSVLYGMSLSSRLRGAHFVVDTSRNGNGPTETYEWCNARGRALGKPSTTDTRLPLVDAFLWIKPPGESDGVCNGGPAEGTWWREYAVELGYNASW